MASAQISAPEQKKAETLKLIDETLRSAISLRSQLAENDVLKTEISLNIGRLYVIKNKVTAASEDEVKALRGRILFIKSQIEKVQKEHADGSRLPSGPIALDEKSKADKKVSAEARTAIAREADALVENIKSAFYVTDAGPTALGALPGIQNAWAKLQERISALATQRGVSKADSRAFASGYVQGKLKEQLPEEIAQLCTAKLFPTIGSEAAGEDRNISLQDLVREYQHAFYGVIALDAAVKKEAFGTAPNITGEAKAIFEENGGNADKLMGNLEGSREYAQAAVAVLYGANGEAMLKTAGALGAQTSGSAYDIYMSSMEKAIEKAGECREIFNAAKRRFSQATNFVETYAKTIRDPQTTQEYSNSFDFFGNYAYAKWAGSIERGVTDDEVLSMVRGRNSAYADGNGVLALPSFYQSLAFDSGAISEAMASTVNAGQRQQVMLELVNSGRDVYSLSTLKNRGKDTADFFDAIKGMRSSSSLLPTLQNDVVGLENGTLRVKGPVREQLFRTGVGDSVLGLSNVFGIAQALNIEKDLAQNSDEVRRFLSSWPSVQFPAGPGISPYLRKGVSYDDVLGYIMMRKGEILSRGWTPFNATTATVSGDLTDISRTEKSRTGSAQAELSGAGGSSIGAAYKRDTSQTGMLADGTFTADHNRGSETSVSATNTYFGGVMLYNALLKHFTSGDTARSEKGEVLTKVTDAEKTAKLNAVGLGANIVFDGYYQDKGDFAKGSKDEKYRIEDTNLYIYHQGAWYRLNVDYLKDPKLEGSIKHYLAMASNVDVGGGMRATVGTEQYEDEKGKLKGFVVGWSTTDPLNKFAGVGVVSPTAKLGKPTSRQAYVGAYQYAPIGEDGQADPAKATLISAGFFDLRSGEELQAQDRAVKRGTRNREIDDNRLWMGDYLVMDRFRATGIAGHGLGEELRAGQVLSQNAGASAVYRFNPSHGTYELRTDAGAYFGSISIAAYRAETNTQDWMGQAKGKKKVEDAGTVTIDLGSGYSLQVFGKEPGAGKSTWSQSLPAGVSTSARELAHEIEATRETAEFKTDLRVRMQAVEGWSTKVAGLVSSMRDYMIRNEVIDPNNNFGIKLNTPKSSYTLVASPVQESDGSSVLMTGIFERDIGSGFAVVGGLSYLEERGKPRTASTGRGVGFGGVYYRTGKLKMGGIILQKPEQSVVVQGDIAWRTKSGQIGITGQRFDGGHQIELFDEFGAHRIMIDRTTMRRLESKGISYSYLINQVGNQLAATVRADMGKIENIGRYGVTGTLTWTDSTGLTLEGSYRREQAWGGAQPSNQEIKFSARIPLNL
ncbi:Uncharacterised protein [Candidatus Anstonella stagnisolia]|nr:Uncharacterised protein [Candidatus Anstonella stagnisolia]